VTDDEWAEASQAIPAAKTMAEMDAVIEKLPRDQDGRELAEGAVMRRELLPKP
jgi:hypothetical protein